MALVLIGFMGAGKSSAARELAAAVGRQPRSTATRSSWSASGTRSPRSSSARGEDSFRAVEEEVVCGLLAGADERAVVSLGGGSVLSERVQGGPARAHDGAARRRSGELLGAGGGRPRPRTAAPGHRPGLPSSRCTAARQDLYEQVADAIVVAPVRGTLGHAAPSLAQARREPRHADAVGPLELGGIPGVPRRRAARRTAARSRCGRWTADASRPFLVSDENVQSPSTGTGSARSPAASRSRPGRCTRRSPQAERVWRELLARRADPRRPRRGPRGRGGGRPGRLLRGHLPARDRPRAGAHQPRRPGRLRLRGQDRGRPSRRQELRRRLPPAGRRDGRPGHALEPARGRAGGRAGWRC